ncbi:MAG: aminoglycoside phosphotransferase family protein [Kineosporiaceae bacterium]
MEDFPPRQVTLVLTDGRGTTLGSLPPFEVATPWWQQVEEVVEGAREAFGLELVVVRLLRAGAESVVHGGPVTYLAEPAVPRGPGLAATSLSPAALDALLTPWDGPDPLAEQPLRAPWARPGGAVSDVAWALSAVAVHGAADPDAVCEQVRTWNLSSIWRVPWAGGRAWLKVVPPFFAHEVGVLAALQGSGRVPRLLAGDVHDGCGRMVLANARSDDATADRGHRVRRGLSALVPLQAECAGRLASFAALGVPDRRDDDVVVDTVARLLDANRSHLSDADRADARALVRDLPSVLAAERAAGLPDTLVHGDFHVGNVLGAGEEAVILDWGDSSLGQPARDVVRMVRWLPEPERDAAWAHAVALWAQAWPGADLAVALAVAQLTDDLLGAAAWQGFLDRIEPDERVYHEGDPPVGIANALRTWRALG